jgi:uncharacterized protein YndB with AHSA1/START domain
MTTASDRLRVTQRVRGTREKVYRAFGDPRLARKWGPDGCRVVSFKATMRVGGTFREAMKCDGDVHTAYGVYKKIAPNKAVVFTHQWREEDSVETLVRVEFKDRKGGTEIVLTQRGFRDAAETRGHKKGWASALKNFAKLYATQDGARSVNRQRAG